MAIEKLVHFPFCLVARVSVPLLHSSDELLCIAFDASQVIVRQLTPLRLNLTLQLVPLALDNVLVHVGLHVPMSNRCARRQLDTSSRCKFEVRYHAQHGVEFQIFCDDDFWSGRRFDPRLGASRLTRGVPIHCAQEMRRPSSRADGGDHHPALTDRGIALNARTAVRP
jgi:hypothetical protein